MASNRLKRKALRNRVVARKKVDTIQRLNTKPVIKNVDIEEIKKEFAAGNINKPVEFKGTPKSKPAKAEAKTEKKAETKKAEPKKAEAKKSETKKAAPKQENAESATGVDVDALLKSVGKANESDKDDLKKIAGIGPAFEKKLNEVGLYTYEQISNLKKNDIENLSKVEGVSAEKIESDNWVETAKNLMEANKGE